MPAFITIGYGDAACYEETDRSVRDAARDQDALVRADGARTVEGWPLDPIP